MSRRTSALKEQRGHREDVQTSMRDQVEHGDGRGYRWTRPRKLQHVSAAPIFNRSLTARRSWSLKEGHSIWPDRPSRRPARHTRALLYVSKDSSAAPTAREAHAMHMFTVKDSVQPSCRKCGGSPKAQTLTPRFFFINTSRHPRWTPVSICFTSLG